MRRKRKVIRKSPSYARCCLITLGIIFVGTPVYAFATIGDSAPSPDWFRAVMAGILVLGLFSIAAGAFASDQTVESWLNAGTQHDASIVILILAAPLYFTLKLLAWRPQSAKTAQSNGQKKTGARRSS
jgi:uncharacterized membrane protein